ncbi:hypothetical protein BT96DRAFT_913217 [Gymnopus androsaceus JB14]|uniref:Uncharacterized protein n=1 Tax=Gymnopus androsaceus JB14 TaxID=1447944 RepID=A0A6A4IC24_9AGAR|nr:hypothetical protein BT96DRAFT_913217 [Gymnopus androsaceus JB14]
MRDERRYQNNQNKSKRENEQTSEQVTHISPKKRKRKTSPQILNNRKKTKRSPAPETIICLIQSLTRILKRR